MRIHYRLKLSICTNELRQEVPWPNNQKPLLSSMCVHRPSLRYPELQVLCQVFLDKFFLKAIQLVLPQLSVVQGIANSIAILLALAGSTNIPIGTLVQAGDVTADGARALRQLVHALSDDVQAVDICLICRTGARSSVACAALSKRLSEGPALDVGTDGRHVLVVNVVGGLQAWSEKVDPRIHV